MLSSRRAARVARRRRCMGGSSGSPRPRFGERGWGEGAEVRNEEGESPKRQASSISLLPQRLVLLPVLRLLRQQLLEALLRRLAAEVLPALLELDRPLGRHPQQLVALVLRRLRQALLYHAVHQVIVALEVVLADRPALGGV